MAKNNAAQVWFILDLSAQSSYLLPSATSDNASAYIDALLQDTWLFVMDIYNQPERVRDEALYRRGVELVEKMQEQLNTMNESEAFRNDVLLAQCALIDHVVLNTASCDDNALWVYAPLQSVYLHTLYAGKNMNDRTRQLLREVSPDRRLLVLHQRAYALGLGRFETQQHQQAFNPALSVICRRRGQNCQCGSYGQTVVAVLLLRWPWYRIWEICWKFLISKVRLAGKECGWLALRSFQMVRLRFRAVRSY